MIVSKEKTTLNGEQHSELKDTQATSETMILDEMKSQKGYSQDFSTGKTLKTERTQESSDGKRDNVISHSIGNKRPHQEQVRAYSAQDRMKGQLLSTRCAISTVAGASKLLCSLDQLSKIALSAVGLLHLFTLPCIPQNIPLLYTLICHFDATKRCFVLGGEDLLFTVNDVALILGLPNKGETFDFQPRPLGTMNKHTLKAHLDDLSNDASHPMSLRFDYLVRYILCCFFFPQKTYDPPKELLEFSGFANFRKYNWPQAIHQVPDDQLPRLAEKAKLGVICIGLGYIGGCSIILVIWILERTKFYDVPHLEARPRICRYSEKTKFSYQTCRRLSSYLKGKVLNTMVDITSLELESIKDDDEEEYHCTKFDRVLSEKEPHTKRGGVKLKRYLNKKFKCINEKIDCLRKELSRTSET